MGKSPRVRPTARTGAPVTTHSVRLRLTVLPLGEPGVVAGPRTAPSAPPRWVAWTKAIAARYTARVAWRRPAGMLFVRPSVSVLVSQRRSHTAFLTLSPRVDLRRVTVNRVAGEVNALRGSPAANGGRGGRGAVLRLPGTSMTTLVHQLRREELAKRLLAPQGQEPVQASANSAQTGMMVRRLLARGERVEAFGYAGIPGRRLPAAAAASHAASDNAGGEPAEQVSRRPGPMPLVYRRPGVVSTEAETRDGRRTYSVEAQTAVRQTLNPLSQNPSQGPSVEVNQLTDQVIQTLDRRLTAWRERMGRM